MVSNRSLAQIAEQYGLPEMFIANASSKFMIQAAQKAKGSLFEAYVAGVYYSFLMPREDAESESSGETIRPPGSPRDDSPKAEPDASEEGEDEEEEVTNANANDEAGKLEPDDVPGESQTSQLDHPNNDQPAGDSCESIQGQSAMDQNSISHSISETTKIKLDSTGEGKETGIDDLCTLGLRSKPQSTSTTAPSADDLANHVSTPSSSTATPPHPIKPRTHGQAFDHLCSWLWPLFTPVAEFLSSYLETESSLTLLDNCPTPHPNQLQNVPNEWKIEDTNATGAIGALNQYLGKSYGSGYLPTWITKKRVMDVWRMVCIVRTPEGKEW